MDNMLTTAASDLKNQALAWQMLAQDLCYVFAVAGRGRGNKAGIFGHFAS